MADKPKKIIPDADYKRLMPKFRAHVISESAAKRLGLTAGKSTASKTTPAAPKSSPTEKTTAPKPPEPAKVKPSVEPKAKSSALKKKLVDDAPITISKGKRGATRWRKGNGPWRYDEPPAQHKPKVEGNLVVAKVDEPPKAVKPTSSPRPASSRPPSVQDLEKRAALLPRSGTVTWSFHGGDPHIADRAHAFMEKIGDKVAKFVGGSMHVDIEFSRAMHSELLGGEAGGFYHYRERKISLNANASVGGAQEILAHEFGHAIDYKAGTTSTEPMPLSGHHLRFTSDVPLTEFAHARLVPLMHAVEKSEKMRVLRETMRDPQLHPNGKKILDYLLRPSEVFARAFGQWAITRHGSPEAMTALRRRPTTEQYGQPPSQWTRRDFEPIAREFDKLFG